MDLPNVVEKLRTIYTAGSVDVIWKGELWRQEFLEKQESIEAHWTILELEEFDRTYSNRFRTTTFYYMRLTLKRRELPEPLLADEPAPCSGWGYYSLDSDPQRAIRF